MSPLLAAEGRVAYLLKRFPRLSETFVLHEILELERQGVALRLYSIMDPGESIVHRSVHEVRAPLRYFPTGLRGVKALFSAHAALWKRSPGRYARAASHLLLHWHHPAAIKHFIRAGWLARELQDAHVTHLHAHFAHGPAAVAYFVHRLTGIPYSVTAHAKDIYTSPPDLLARKLRAARFVVTCTEYNARFLASLSGSADTDRIHRIYHGIDLHLFEENPAPAEPSAGADEPTILAVGRLVEKKGFTYLVEAARLLIADGHRVRLKIVGGGELKDELTRQIVDAGLEGRAELVGALPQEKVIELYRSASVMVLPSVVTEDGDRDGIPNVLVEAMRLGCPVVSTNVSGIPELVIDGETGLLVPPGDAPALAAAIARVLADGALREHVRQGARRHVSREFDLAANAAQLKSLLLGAEAVAA
ncbi:MAG TPA: glycosyltransferase [Chloroflexota bacterium]|nr:glycosyltransferase [Chloroflexota bacterium]